MTLKALEATQRAQGESSLLLIEPLLGLDLSLTATLTVNRHLDSLPWLTCRPRSAFEEKRRRGVSLNLLGEGLGIEGTCM